MVPFHGTIEQVNTKNEKTLKLIYATPITATIKWSDIVSLLLAVGAEISEGRGSRVRVKLRGQRAVFHRPHPQNVTDRGAVRSMRKFLENAGVKP